MHHLRHPAAAAMHTRHSAAAAAMPAKPSAPPPARKTAAAPPPPPVRARSRVNSSSGARSRVPLHLLRHGCALIAFGLLFGFVVPYTPYPRLGLTAHIQFCAEGTMVLAAALLLQSDPFGGGALLADRLGPRQRLAVYAGLSMVWVTLLSEALNAWWGTQWVLKMAHEAAGLRGDGPAQPWMEVVVDVCHKPPALLLSLVVSRRCPCRVGCDTDGRDKFPIILYALFDEG